MSLIAAQKGHQSSSLSGVLGVPETFDVTISREAIDIPAVVYEPQAEGKVVTYSP